MHDWRLHILYIIDHFQSEMFKYVNFIQSCQWRLSSSIWTLLVMSFPPSEDVFGDSNGAVLWMLPGSLVLPLEKHLYFSLSPQQHIGYVSVCICPQLSLYVSPPTLRPLPLPLSVNATGLSPFSPDLDLSLSQTFRPSCPKLTGGAQTPSSPLSFLASTFVFLFSSSLPLLAMPGLCHHFFIWHGNRACQMSELDRGTRLVVQDFLVPQRQTCCSSSQAMEPLAEVRHSADSPHPPPISPLLLSVCLWWCCVFGHGFVTETLPRKNTHA